MATQDDATDRLLARLLNRTYRYLCKYEDTGEAKYLTIAMESDRLYLKLKHRDDN